MTEAIRAHTTTRRPYKATADTVKATTKRLLRATEDTATPRTNITGINSPSRTDTADEIQQTCDVGIANSSSRNGRTYTSKAGSRTRKVAIDKGLAPGARTGSATMNASSSSAWNHDDDRESSEDKSEGFIKDASCGRNVLGDSSAGKPQNNLIREDRDKLITPPGFKLSDAQSLEDRRLHCEDRTVMSGRNYSFFKAIRLIFRYFVPSLDKCL